MYLKKMQIVCDELIGSVICDFFASRSASVMFPYRAVDEMVKELYNQYICCVLVHKRMCLQLSFEGIIHSNAAVVIDTPSVAL